MQTKIGDRIELLSMDNDPNPVQVGSKGTITHINEVKSMDFTQYSVKWDSGRTLLLCVPPDTFMNLGEDR